MNRLLSGTSLAALLLLAPQIAAAQAQPQGQNQPQRQATGAAQGAIPPQAMAQLQQAEQSLTQAARQMGSATGPQQAQATQSVRQALTQVQQALAQVPEARRTSESYRTLETRVREAQGALQGDRPDMARARTSVDAVIVAIPVMRAESAGTEGGTGAQIVLRQAPDQVQVQQAAPQVTVQQAQPEVLVVIPQPEIVVRQPPAQVTVRMPEPQVAVQQGQPQVRVEQSQPNVNVVPTQQQAQVQVQQAEPRVTVQQQGQPQVRFEQTGQAQVRVEQQGQAARSAAPGSQAQNQAGQSQAAQNQAGSQSMGGVPLQRVSELVGTNVVGANGRNAGEVENLLIDRSGNVRAAVIEWGGFLGIGQRRAVVPIEELQFTDGTDRAQLNMSREQLEQLGSYDQNNLSQYSSRYGWGEGVRTYR